MKDDNDNENNNNNTLVVVIMQSWCNFGANNASMS